MKKLNVILGLLAMSLATYAAGTKGDDQKITYSMPEKVKVVFENKCFGCHNDEGRSDKAKEGLNFSTLEQLDKFKKIASWNEAKKEIEGAKMPPAKLIEKHPEAALTKEESELLVEWIKTETSSLLKQ